MAVLTELPGTEQFGLGGYSNVASHKHKIPQGLEIDKLKAIAKATWTKAGADRLVKVLPGAPHSTTLDPGIQYPPGYGAPQWIVKVKLRATVVAVINDYPNGRYVPCGR